MNSPLNITARPVAVKTGTTNDYRDTWIIGYTPNIVVGAWAGNNDNTSIDKKVAGMVIAPMWRAFMDEALPTLQKEYFNTPEPTSKELKPVFRGIWQGYDFFTIDKISGKQATELTPVETQQEIYYPNVHEILYWVDKNDPYGAVPTNPGDDPQFSHWEYPVQQWLKTQYITNPIAPSGHDDVHTISKSPRLGIITPENNSTYSKDQKITIQISNSGAYQLTKVDFYINNTYLGSSSISPFLYSFTPAEIRGVLGGKNTLKVVATDSVFNRGEFTTEFNIGE